MSTQPFEDFSTHERIEAEYTQLSDDSKPDDSKSTSSKSSSWFYWISIPWLTKANPATSNNSESPPNPGDAKSTLNGSKSIPNDSNVNPKTPSFWVYWFSAHWFAKTNPATYALLADFFQQLFNGYDPGKIPADNKPMIAFNYVLAALSFISLGYGNTKTYLKYVNNLFKIPESKEAVREEKSRLEKLTNFIKVDLSTYFNSVIKGGGSSISFATVAANVIGKLLDLTSQQKGLLMSGLATVLLPFNINSQYINFRYGNENSDQNDDEKKSLVRKCRDSSLWKKISEMSKAIYPTTSPLSYNLAFQNSFPQFVADIAGFIRPGSISADDETLIEVTTIINVLFYLALAYDTWKLYHAMDKEAESADEKKSHTDSYCPWDVLTNLRQCLQAIADGPCAQSITRTMKEISKHIASNSKGIISSLGFATFVCQTVMACYSAADSVTDPKSISITNVALVLWGIFANTPAQYASFSIAKEKQKNNEPRNPVEKKEKERKKGMNLNRTVTPIQVYSSENRDSPQSFNSFRAGPPEFHTPDSSKNFDDSANDEEGQKNSAKLQPRDEKNGPPKTTMINVSTGKLVVVTDKKIEKSAVTKPRHFSFSSESGSDTDGDSPFEDSILNAAPDTPKSLYSGRSSAAIFREPLSTPDSTRQAEDSDSEDENDLEDPEIVSGPKNKSPPNGSNPTAKGGGSCLVM